MTPLMAFLAAFVLAVLALPGLIRVLTHRRAEQVISEDVPETHQVKKGTPTLGGIGIVLPAAAVSLFYAAIHPGPDGADVVALTVLLVATSLLGFWDDYLILSRGRNAGQKWSQKLFLQVLIAATFAGWVWWEHGAAVSYLPVPGFGTLRLELAWLPFAIVFLALVSNGVNLADGLDGLAGGLSLIALAGCAAAAWCVHAPHLGIFALALGGACLGFLWFNCHPASIFMGNTSSIALGMALAGLALLTREVVPLCITFGVFLVEAASVAIQVGYYKRTHRRVFLKAPIHHHFEMLGWKETKVVIRFWIVAILLAVAGHLWLTTF